MQNVIYKVEAYL